MLGRRRTEVEIGGGTAPATVVGGAAPIAAGSGSCGGRLGFWRFALGGSGLLGGGGRRRARRTPARTSPEPPTSMAGSTSRSGSGSQDWWSTSTIDAPTVVVGAASGAGAVGLPDSTPAGCWRCRRGWWSGCGGWRLRGCGRRLGSGGRWWRDRGCGRYRHLRQRRCRDRQRRRMAARSATLRRHWGLRSARPVAVGPAAA